MARGAYRKATAQPEAQAFLRDAAAVGFWCGLMGADVDTVQPQLLKAARLDTGEA